MSETPVGTFGSDQSEFHPFTLKDTFESPTYEQWRAVVEKDLKGAPYDKKVLWKTMEGLDVEPFYSRRDLEGLAHLDSLPGSAPFARGGEPLSGVLPKWQIRQDCILAAPEDVNGAVRDGLARGATAVGIRLDNAARRGLDGDSPEAADKAGTGGMTVSSINGVRIALQDIDLEKFPVSYRTGSAALPILAMHLALAEERGIDPKLLTGSVECDPVRELVKSGHLRGGSMELRYREMAEMATYCNENCPGIRPVLVNSHVWHNGGASAVQELAYTMATGLAYVRAMVSHGLSVEQASLSMIFSMSVSTNLFMEVAKIRAARMLWAKIMKSLGAESDYALKMFLHLRTSAITKSQYDPYNNMVRSAIETFAAAVGGCDSLYVAPFDEVIGRPDEFSSRVARNQQILLQEEVHLDRVVDPAGGSYYVETLTDSVAKAAWELFQEVEADGGIVEALRQGKVQGAVSKVAAKKHDYVSQRRMPIVGVTSYANAKEVPIKKGHLSRGQFLAERRKRLALLKRVRNNRELRHALGEISDSMMGQPVGRVVPVAIQAAAAGATIGEIIQALNEANQNVELKVSPIPGWRPAQEFEALRNRVESYKEENGDAPAIYLVTTGPLTMRRARADFAQGFFSSAGLAISESKPQESPEGAAKDAAASNASVFVLCSDDATYPEFGPVFVKALKALKPKAIVYIAGYPTEHLEALTAAGFDGFIHMKSNLLKELVPLLDKLGINEAPTKS